jgi:hypothetical protein
MKEHDLVAIAHDIPHAGLQRDDVGTIVHVHSDGAGIEAEFVSASGQTLAVLTLASSEYRLLKGDEILHARKMSAPRTP